MQDWTLDDLWWGIIGAAACLLFILIYVALKDRRPRG